MQSYRTEGIILQTRPFQDFDAILTVFSIDQGVIKFIAKGAHRPARRAGMVTTPLTRAEFVYTKGRGDLLKCSEISVNNHYLPLRQSLGVLEAACAMAQSIEHSQWPQTPSSDLFNLFNSYLDKIHEMEDPHVLSASYRLKLLRHDGLLRLAPTCAVCAERPELLYMSAGECVCSAHAFGNGLAFTSDEMAIVCLLTYCRSFLEVGCLVLTPELRQKITQCFEDCLA